MKMLCQSLSLRLLYCPIADIPQALQLFVLIIPKFYGEITSKLWQKQIADMKTWNISLDGDGIALMY